MVKVIPVLLACCGYLISNQNVLISTTHIKKGIARLYFFVLRRKLTEKQYAGQKFCRGQKFRLTPVRCRVARLAFSMPNLANLALFTGSWRQKNSLAFWLFFFNNSNFIWQPISPEPNTGLVQFCCCHCR